MNFEQFGFTPQIAAGISAAGYQTPTPIQLKSIPQILSGKDLIGLAQTGTGKTAAFALPLLQRLSYGRTGVLRALVLSPTRELAEQTYRAIQALGRKTGLRAATVYGGVSPVPQIRALRSGVEIVVACPGRLLDLIGQRQVRMERIETVIIDEADMMFDMGFLPDVRRILALVPEKRQTLLFSATMSKEIRKLAEDILVNPVAVEINASKPIETVSHGLCKVETADKFDALLELIYGSGNGQVLVFTRTKHRASKVALLLAKAGIAATALQGNMSQNQRAAAMDRFRSGKARVMVATDIAARGIDVSQVTHVINYDLPDTAEAYTHRIGRTGRMERLGSALTLATREDAYMVRTIEKLLGKPMEYKPVSRPRPAQQPVAA